LDLRPTKYSDICATLDELKETFAGDPERLSREPDAVRSLFDDIRYMFGRMHRRLDEYARFTGQLQGIVVEMKNVPHEDLQGALEKLSVLQGTLEENPETPRTALEKLNTLAEQVRDIANHQEQLLRDHKALWIRVWRLYQQVKGYRNWSEEEQASDK